MPQRRHGGGWRATAVSGLPLNQRGVNSYRSFPKSATVANWVLFCLNVFLEKLYEKKYGWKKRSDLWAIYWKYEWRTSVARFSRRETRDLVVWRLQQAVQNASFSSFKEMIGSHPIRYLHLLSSPELGIMLLTNLGSKPTPSLRWPGGGLQVALQYTWSLLHQVHSPLKTTGGKLKRRMLGGCKEPEGGGSCQDVRSLKGAFLKFCLCFFVVSPFARNLSL